MERGDFQQYFSYIDEWRMSDTILTSSSMEVCIFSTGSEKNNKQTNK
jgi:hypothetical protein